MGLAHQDPDYYPPIHPAKREEDSDEDGGGPSTPSSGAEGAPGACANSHARARLALAAAQSIGGAGAPQAPASGYSEVCALLRRQQGTTMHACFGFWVQVGSRIACWVAEQRWRGTS